MPKVKRGTVKSPTVRVVLRCGHTISLSPPPKRGDEVYCTRCQDWRLVGIIPDPEYRAKCEVCKFGRRYGAEKWAAEYAAKRHQDKTGHFVMVLREEVKPDDGT